MKLLLDFFPTDKGIKEVYLFGSIITNDTGQDSDIDIVIVRDDGKEITIIPRHYRTEKAVDILNISVGGFLEERNKLNSVYKDAYTKGIKIYERSD